MEEKEKYVLPYDFIEPDEIDTSYSYKSKGNLTGVMHVTLTVKTPLFAVREYADKAPNPNLIPGSSIRGMVRNAAEIIWNDHISVVKYTEDFHKIPEEWQKKNITIRQHGLSSHLFGFMTKNLSQESYGEPLSNVMSSSIKFTDALAKVSPVTYSDNFKRDKRSLTLPKGLTCKYYLTKDRTQSAGRKIYLAGATRNVKKKLTIEDGQVPEELQDFVGTTTIWNPARAREVLIHPNNTYSFRVYFEKITRTELADFVRLLELEEGAYHALGKGKPLGFGRVSMVVDHILVRDFDDFFNLDCATYSKEIDKAELLETEVHRHEKLFNEFVELSRPSQFNYKKSYPKNTLISVRYRLNKQILE